MSNLFLVQFGHLFFTNVSLINAKILLGMITNGASLENLQAKKTHATKVSSGDGYGGWWWTVVMMVVYGAWCWW
jgi:hypothetical protein